MLSLLIECSVLMLRVIYDMYLRQRITYEEFLNYTEVKIQFLLENMSSISTEIEREKASDIINKCTSAKTQKHSQHKINALCLSTDMLQ